MENNERTRLEDKVLDIRKHEEDELIKETHALYRMINKTEKPAHHRTKYSVVPLPFKSKTVYLVCPPTNGCSHLIEDGGCVGCNYGTGEGFDERRIIREIKETGIPLFKGAVLNIPKEEALKLMNRVIEGGEIGERAKQKIDTLFKERRLHDEAHIMPTFPGSFFDKKEVPVGAQKRILEMIGETFTEDMFKRRVLGIESRIDTVREEPIAMIKETLPGWEFEWGWGLEAYNKLYAEALVNKHLPEDWKHKAKLLKKEKSISSMAHLLYGIPILSHEEQIRETVSGVDSLVREGLCDELAIMTMHLKEGTAIDLLHKISHELETPLFEMPDVMGTLEIAYRVHEGLWKMLRRGDIKEEQMPLWTTYSGFENCPKGTVTAESRIIEKGRGLDALYTYLHKGGITDPESIGPVRKIISQNSQRWDEYKRKQWYETTKKLGVKPKDRIKKMVSIVREYLSAP